MRSIEWSEVAKFERVFFFIFHSLSKIYMKSGISENVGVYVFCTPPFKTDKYIITLKTQKGSTDACPLSKRSFLTVVFYRYWYLLFLSECILSIGIYVPIYWILEIVFFQLEKQNLTIYISINLAFQNVLMCPCMCVCVWVT